MKAYGSRGLKIYTKGVDYLTKNSATPIYGKIIQKSLFSRTSNPIAMKLDM